MYKLTYINPFIGLNEQTVEMNYTALENFLRENPIVEVTKCEYEGQYYNENLTEKVLYLHSTMRNLEYKKRDIERCHKIEEEIKSDRIHALISWMLGE